MNLDGPPFGRANHLLRLMGLPRRYLAYLAGSIILIATAGIATAIIPLLVGSIFYRVLDPRRPDSPILLYEVPILHHRFYLNDVVPEAIHNVWTMVAATSLAVFVIKGLCDYFGSYLVNYVGLSAISDLRNTVFAKAQKQGAEFHEAPSTGRVMSSIMNDIARVEVALSPVLTDLLRQFFTAVCLILVMLGKDWRLALLSVLALPSVGWTAGKIGNRIRAARNRAQDRRGELNQILEETMRGRMVVEAFNAETYESQRFRDAEHKLRLANMKYVMRQALSSSLLELIGAIAVVVLVTFVRGQIKANSLTPEDFASFVIALVMLLQPLKRLVGIHNISGQAIGASQNVLDYLDQPESIVEMPGASKLDGFRDSIVFDHVDFRYSGLTEGFRLSSISLEVRAGEIVALVGPSGSGKSTIASLVPRFYDVTGGVIRIDGRDIREVELASLRAQIGIVAQDTFLFNDTVARNIAYGCPRARIDDIRRAGAAALAGEFIERLPDGYETVVGDRGLKLSAGQRQRLAIARALLKNAPILILDEATSHLDAESEILVQEALANLMQGRTVIVIAHRLSTIRRADKIVVLDKGQIREIGTHHELVNHRGIYWSLQDLQFELADL